MRISTKGRYALTAMVDLAGHSEGRPVSINEIARRQGLPFHYVEQLFIKLKKVGLLESTRGAQGGYMLTKPAGEITAATSSMVTEMVRGKTIEEALKLSNEAVAKALGGAS